jgi:hypothetical protein
MVLHHQECFRCNWPTNKRSATHGLVNKPSCDKSVAKLWSLSSHDNYYPALAFSLSQQNSIALPRRRLWASAYTTKTNPCFASAVWLKLWSSLTNLDKSADNYTKEPSLWSPSTTLHIVHGSIVYRVSDRSSDGTSDLLTHNFAVLQVPSTVETCLNQSSCHPQKHQNLR